MKAKQWVATVAALLALLPTATVAAQTAEDAAGWRVVAGTDRVRVEENDDPKPTFVIEDSFVGILPPGATRVPAGATVETSVVVDGTEQLLWRSGDGPLDPAVVATLGDYLAHVEYHCTPSVRPSWDGSTGVTARLEFECWGSAHEGHSLISRLQRDLSGDWLDIAREFENRDILGWIRIFRSYRCGTDEWRNRAGGQIWIDDVSDVSYGPTFQDNYGYCS